MIFVSFPPKHSRTFRSVAGDYRKKVPLAPIFMQNNFFNIYISERYRNTKSDISVNVRKMLRGEPKFIKDAFLLFFLSTTFLLL